MRDQHATTLGCAIASSVHLHRLLNLLTGLLPAAGMVMMGVGALAGVHASAKKR